MRKAIQKTVKKAKDTITRKTRSAARKAVDALQHNEPAIEAPPPGFPADPTPQDDLEGAGPDPEPEPSTSDNEGEGQAGTEPRRSGSGSGSGSKKAKTGSQKYRSSTKQNGTGIKKSGTGKKKTRADSKPDPGPKPDPGEGDGVGEGPSQITRIESKEKAKGTSSDTEKFTKAEGDEGEAWSMKGSTKSGSGSGTGSSKDKKKKAASVTKEPAGVRKSGSRSWRSGSGSWRSGSGSSKSGWGSIGEVLPIADHPPIIPEMGNVSPLLLKPEPAEDWGAATCPPPAAGSAESDGSFAWQQRRAAASRLRGADFAAWIEDPHYPNCPRKLSKFTLDQARELGGRYKEYAPAHLEETEYDLFLPPQEELPRERNDYQRTHLEFNTTSSLITITHFLIDIEKFQRDKDDDRPTNPFISDQILAMYKSRHSLEGLRYIFVSQIVNRETAGIITFMYPRRELGGKGCEKGSEAHSITASEYEAVLTWEEYSSSLDPNASEPSAHGTSEHSNRARSYSGGIPIDPTPLEHGTPAYYQTLGSQIGRQVASTVLGGYPRGTVRIARIWVYEGGNKALQLRFDLEPLPVLIRVRAEDGSSLYAYFEPEE
ncbi:hypothetical protein N7520_007094 [Penicillium odoratum]|uniref:uncharacterized protein n=1 Tax=Penicillium odoratum TaxID=1167516 RepID=UPI0025469B67|nr:uncharacterized protein N7520_007094 [Penicillium odoratum]KAJ5759938.1 hypothetical protein N7520_007094 [Penicillium odoratum]